jgi:hypothetical protein
MLYHKKIGDEVHGEENFNNELQKPVYTSELPYKERCYADF